SLRYNSKTSADKIKDADAAPGKILTTTKTSTVTVDKFTTAATASQTVNANNSTSFGVAGVSILGTGVRRFSVAAVNDPITYALASSGRSGSLTTSIGGDFMLQATAPGEFASAYFEVGTDQQSPGTINTLLGFSISIDSTTTLLSGVAYEFDTFDPSIGF